MREWNLVVLRFRNVFKGPGGSARSIVPLFSAAALSAWAEWFAQNKWQENADEENDQYFQNHGADNGEYGNFFEVVPWEVAGSSKTDEFGQVHDVKVKVCTHDSEGILAVECE